MAETGTTATALEAGEQAAIKPSVIGWGVFGWAIALVAVPMVYLRSPKMPLSLAAAHDDRETLPLFERAYVERLKARQVKAVWIGFLCAVGMFVLLAIVSAGADSPSVGGSSAGGIGETVREAVQDAVETQRVVTMDEFTRIREGMTYAQVRDIIGAAGTELSRTTMLGTTTIMYGWTNRDFSNMNAMFQDDALVSKAQFGL